MKLRLRELMLERSITSAALAEKMGISKGAVDSTIIRNTASLDVLENYANALDVPVWKLFTTCGLPNIEPQPSVNGMVYECPKCGKKLQINITVTDL